MMDIFKLIGATLILSGIIFQFFGIYGIVVHRNFFVNLSLSSLIDSAGLFAILIGLIFYNGLNMASLKIGFIILLMLLLNPLSNHILGRGAYLSNYHPQRRAKK
ncbi:MAG: monovalent cation/H(+) antiporter subunit G [Erysipelotrichaceae bacterium]|nr:monovalent cation/H(+) antiporter subunit G [Erysipelotrichaceae bacterium]